MGAGASTAAAEERDQKKVKDIRPEKMTEEVGFSQLN